MSDTTVPAAPATAPTQATPATPAPATAAPSAAASTATPAALSTELKSAILAAADAHLAAVTADVAKVKGAVSGDLAGLATTGKSEFDRLESSVLAEIAKLRADLAGAKPRYYVIAAAVVVASAGAAFGHFIAHLF